MYWEETDRLRGDEVGRRREIDRLRGDDVGLLGVLPRDDVLGLLGVLPRDVVDLRRVLLRDVLGLLGFRDGCPYPEDRVLRFNSCFLIEDGREGNFCPVFVLDFVFLYFFDSNFFNLKLRDLATLERGSLSLGFGRTGR